MEFGELRDVNLREAWPNEANDFTPWLAENLPRLSEVIGVDMELEDTEVPVEGYSADVVATFPANGSRVVIENQLGHTDHTHLGQLLTYLSGLEAQTAIWIASEFQRAHLTAVQWLNLNTPNDLAFFAVKVRAVRIGDAPSLVAPVFEVLEKPGDWQSRVGAIKRLTPDDRLTRLRAKRNDFWKLYVQRHPGDIHLRDEFRESNVYHSIAGVVVSQYLARKEVGVYLAHRHRNYDSGASELVGKYRVTLKRELGSWIVILNVDTDNRDNWPHMVDWLHDQLIEFRRVLTEHAADTETAG